MDLVDIFTNALRAGAQAGAVAASSAERDLTQDIDNFVIPHFRDIAIQLASIVQKHMDGTYTDVTAKALIDSEEDAIQTIVETTATLAVLEAQTIVNSTVDALNKSVNTALGFVLLA